MPEEFNVALLERAHEDGAVYGSKAVGEPPLMLAFSVREALRQARRGVRAGRVGRRAAPATPEAVYWARKPVLTAASRRRLGPPPQPVGIAVRLGAERGPDALSHA